VAACAVVVGAIGSPTVLAGSKSLNPAKPGNRVIGPKDLFTGRITAATGKFAGDRDVVTIILAPGRGQATRHLTATITGAACTGKPHCVQLAGKLTGTITSGPIRVPDVGRSFAIAATGTIKPLGHVSATGTVQGTGFIANGHESLKLRLTRHGASITIDATSGQVPGFTSP